MSALDFINYLHIREVQTDNKNQTRMLEAQGRAEHIGALTGKKPMNWYEFKQADKTPDKKGSAINGLLGAMVGAAVTGLAVMLSVGSGGIAPLLALGIMLGGGVAGAIIGSGYAHPDEARSHQLDRYERYLDIVEQESQGKTRAYSIDKMPPLQEGEKTKRYLTEQDMAIIAGASAMAK